MPVLKHHTVLTDVQATAAESERQAMTAHTEAAGVPPAPDDLPVPAVPLPVTVIVSAEATTVAELAVPVPVVPWESRLDELAATFATDPELRAVVTLTAAGPAVVPRQVVLANNVGHACPARPAPRRVRDVLTGDTLVLPGATSLEEAAHRLLARPETERYDDVVIEVPAGVALLSATAVFEQLSQLLAHRGQTDPLTGLPNRLLLAQRVEALVAHDAPHARGTGPRSGQPGSIGEVALAPMLLSVDLDGFKPVNDRHGFSLGDTLLVQFAQRLRQCVRGTDVVARLAADEFAVLLVEPVSMQDAVAVAERVVLAAAAPFLLGAQVVTLGASVGVAALDRKTSDLVAATGEMPLEVLLRHADQALQRAKRRGRGRAEVFDPAAADADLIPAPRHASDLLTRLRLALQEGHLQLHYQPKVELPSGRLMEVEALARWSDPQLGPVSPAVFIPLAERSPLIRPIGEWALRTACQQAVRWATHGAGPVVAVNLSPPELADPGMVRLVAAVLEETGLPANRLSLEITETAAIDDLEGAVATLNALRDLGVQVALDDFGTGYSSLTLIRRLPVTTVKIDRSFVDRVDVDPKDVALIRMVIEAAHSLGLQVCAEGVERASQLVQLVAMGCDTAQGYLLGRPQPAEALQPVGQVVSAVPEILEHSGPAALATTRELVTIRQPGRGFTYVSAGSISMLGYQPAEMLQTSPLDHVFPEDRQRVTAAFADLGYEPRTVTHRLRHRDGSVVWVDATLRLLGDARGGEAPVVLTSARDVTERIDREVALATRERQLRATFDAAPVALFIASREGTLLDHNRSASELLARHSRYEPLRTVTDLVAAQDRTALADAVAGLSVTEHPNFGLGTRWDDGQHLSVYGWLVPSDPGHAPYLAVQVEPVP